MGATEILFFCTGLSIFGWGIYLVAKVIVGILLDIEEIKRKIGMK